MFTPNPTLRLALRCGLLLGAAALAVPVCGAPASGAGRRSEPLVKQVRLLEERAERAEVLAGLTPLEGPGLLVTLRNCPHPAPPGADPTGLVIHDQDVNAVLNALRAAGAEALAVASGSDPQAPAERVVAATSAVETGSGMLVNGHLVRPPYLILAIGDAKLLTGELFRSGGAVKRAGLDTLEMAEAHPADALRVPAARVAPPLRFGHTVDPNTPAPPLPPAPPASLGTPPLDTTPHPAADRHPVAERKPPAHPAAAPTVRTTHVGAPPAAPSSSNTDQMPARLQAGVFGARGQNRYHMPGCRFGERIDAADRVYYPSAEAAAKAGRVPCPFCCPPSR